jgi:Lrp/AsnC family transcriptional regulator for asnA, asnC and gidA
MATEGRTAGRIRLDGVDKRIIEALQTEGRRPFRRIADDLAVSESAVRYRVQRLQEAGILQIVGLADPLRIGFATMALVGVRVQPGHLAEVSRRICALSEVSYVAMVTGSFDLFAEVICRDPADFTEFLTERLHRIEGIIGVESFMILQLHKLSYRWGAAAAEPNKRADGVATARAPRKRATKARPATTGART